MSSSARFIPIYTTRGDLGAYLVYPYIVNRSGEWIGWVTPERVVYSVHGHYVGEMNSDPRILRKREASYHRERLKPFPEPPPLRPPQTVPLAPLMREIPQNLIDVLEEAPEMLPPIDHGDLRDDLD